MASIFWFRRDLRLEDNVGFYEALKASKNVIPLFIFDESIIEDLPKNDPRVNFIYQSLISINTKLADYNSSLLCLKGNVENILKQLIEEFAIDSLYTNGDYEPYAIQRDENVKKLLENHGASFFSFKDQVIFEKDEVLKKDGKPYTVFTPYKNQWLAKYNPELLTAKENDYKNLYKKKFTFPTLAQLGLERAMIQVKPYTLEVVKTYGENRDYPFLDHTSYLSPHLRFGTVSIRQIIKQLKGNTEVFLSELIWREFFMQILFHYPKVVTNNFRAKYDVVKWRDHEADFLKWCTGNTGYPMVDAGMRQLNETGYMHNRVRMITAGFLCKHLLIDWKWGEAYFAAKLLDYELSSNNGNWQWAAGTGCDAAPYFRIFNPAEQLKKFDKQQLYIKKWVPEYGSEEYVEPMVEHKFARERALKAYAVTK